MRSISHCRSAAIIPALLSALFLSSCAIFSTEIVPAPGIRDQAVIEYTADFSFQMDCAYKGVALPSGDFVVLHSFDDDEILLERYSPDLAPRWSVPLNLGVDADERRPALFLLDDHLVVLTSHETDSGSIEIVGRAYDVESGAVGPAVALMNTNSDYEEEVQYGRSPDSTTVFAYVFGESHDYDTTGVPCSVELCMP